ncbi:Chemotaxis protein methyltransferase 1 [Methylobacterium crusticola]|uniref:protein-glutamate O-methyltransferase n=1 Tax=Methylobacterium crusticola TaxID=1697972 RepID=A0ABQ4QWB9_9HYPH|nr:protein-glutamate O-methyltransferase CheR [Methylobacterium crusticola]GJD48951.1 Chemotaxis protein methyltransferase 1 [Methylobacterium crusticola]
MADTPSPIADADFARFCDFFYRRTGIAFTPAKRYYVDRRLAERMQATGTRSFAAYFGRLRVEAGTRSAGGETERLINALTVNETYFFREEHQLRCLTASLMAEVTAGKGPGDSVRIWSMPCSTGEEPYSVAIWLLEHWPEVDRYEVEIVGSDIDTRVLAAAEAGRYGDRSLMRLTPDLVARYFEPATAAGERRIIAALRGSVRFSACNLMDARATGGEGRFDVVLCRNVLIYFDDASRRSAAGNLYESLVPGGFVCLGHTESMSRISPLFRVCRYADAIVYQRPREGEHV